MTYPFGTTAVIHTRVNAGTDALGVQQYTYTDTSVDNCFYSPGASTELIVSAQDLLTVQPKVYLPPGTSVTAVDQITVSGQRFDVDGSPNNLINPWTGWNPAIAVKLKAVTG